MNKGTHFNGQPMYGQLISLLDKHEILQFSREKKGERYVKHFDAYQHYSPNGAEAWVSPVKRRQERRPGVRFGLYLLLR
jgi:hypothetical protein